MSDLGFTITIEHGEATATYRLGEGALTEDIADAFRCGLLGVGFLPKTANLVGRLMDQGDDQ